MFKKLVNYSLIAVMLVSSFSTKVFAEKMYKEDFTNKVIQKQVKSTEVKQKKKEGKIIKEIVEKRERNIKHFLKDDMTFEAVVYPQPVHYLENGKWKDIDNGLVDGCCNEDINSDLKQDSEIAFGSGTEEEGIKAVLANKENDFKVKIAKNTKSSKFVSVKKGEYEISWDLPNANNVKARQVPVDIKSIDASIERAVDNEISQDKKLVGASPEEKAEIRKIKIENEKKKTLTNIGSKVEFIDVYPEVDLQYETIGNMIKENIIINEKISYAAFKFNIRVNNLVAKLDKDNVITFYDKKDESKVIYKVNAPYMYDVKFQSTNKIKITLNETNKGYELEIIPDKEWLESKDRTYPITIDPPVTTLLGINDIYDNFICSNNLQSKWDMPYLMVGNSSEFGVTRSYIRFTLPKLDSGDMVTNSFLQLEYDRSASNGAQINVHKVEGDWINQWLCWSSNPSYNSKIEDYQIMNGQDAVWDITAIAKEWYNTGKNYGLMLKNHNESVGNTIFASSDNYDANFRPRAKIFYINNTGLESYWGYHSANAGRAGTGYTNDYNGNLVFIHDDLSMNGNKMPVSIKHIFNSNDRALARLDSDLTTSTSAYYGPGWRLNLSQRVMATNIPEAPYKYIDEDGTSHYFSYEATAGKYKDESGVELTLQTNYSSNGIQYGYCITDKKDNMLLFTSTGFLNKIKDSNSNELTLSYNGAVLCEITDGAKRVTTLESDSNGVLLGIVDPSRRRTRFSYNGAVLEQITYPDGNYTTYIYDSNNNLQIAKNYDGVKLTYNYYSSSPYRVRSVSQSHTNGIQGGTLSMAYGYNQTTFTDVENKKFVYQFNNYGNTVSIKDNEGNGQYYKFNDSGNIKNTMALESKVQKVTNNILKNHNVENSSTWGIDSSPGGIGSATFSTVEKYMGNQSLKVLNNNSASNFRFRQDVNLERGKTYTLSGYVKTAGVDALGTGSKGANLFVLFYNNAGSPDIRRSQFVAGTNDWQRIEMSFTVPNQATTTMVQVYAGLNNSPGTAYFDCLQLEEGPVANRYNLIENSNFSFGMDCWGKNGACSGADTVDINNTFVMNGAAGSDKYIYQNVNVSGAAGDSFVFSGWAQGESVPLLKDSGRYFALDICFSRTDGTPAYYVVQFNEACDEWQYLSDVFIAPFAYNSVTVYALYDRNANTARFDNINLYKEEFGTSYQYDANGNIIGTTNLAKQNQSFQYNSNNDLFKASDAKGNQFKYEYDNNVTTLKKHNLTKATSAENVVYSFEYDSSGNPKKSTIGDTSSLFISSSAEYTASGNYLKSITDSSGNTIVNNWDETKGNLSNVVDAKGNTTSYGYDSLDRLTTVSKNIGSINLETFTFSNNTNGSNGTKAVEGNAAYESENGNSYLLSYEGTTNVLPANPSFENGTTGWTLDDRSNLSGRWRLVNDGVNGSQAIECYDSVGTGTNAVAYQYIVFPQPLSSDRIYTISAYAKRTGATQPKIGVDCYDLNNSQILSAYSNYVKTIELNKWTKISQTFMVPKGTKKFMPIIRTGVNGTDTVRFDAIQVEAKPYASPFTLSSSSPTKVVYNLGVNKNSGTMSLKFNYKTSGDKQIFENASSNGKLNLYTDSQDHLILGAAYNNGAWKQLVVSDELVKKGETNFVALKWEYNSGTLNCRLFLNDKCYSGDITDLKDFSGGKTGVGNSILGQYQVNGRVWDFTYTASALNDTDILLLKDGKLQTSPGTAVTNSYNYENDRIQSIVHNGFSYNFGYDSLGNNTTVNVGNQNLITNNYDTRTGKLLSSTYGNGQTVSDGYDNLNRVNKKTIDGILRYTYDFDASGNLGLHKDLIEKIGERYNYDTSNRLVSVLQTELDDTGNIQYAADKQRSFTSYGYDLNNNITLFMQKIKGNGYVTNYNYDKDNKPHGMAYNNGVQKFDNLENFSLCDTLVGSKGTKPYIDKAAFVEDGDKKKVLSSAGSTKVLYNLGLNKDTGTMSAWFNTNAANTDRYIINTESTTKMFNLYVGYNNNLKLLIGSGSTNTWLRDVDTGWAIDTNKWHFTAIRWRIINNLLEYSIYLDGNVVKTDTIGGFKDFANGNTAIGTNINGNYQLNGMLDQFNYTPNALSDEDIRALFQSGRGNSINYSYDSIGRSTAKTINISAATTNSFKVNYIYVKGNVDKATTNRIETMDNNNKKIIYTYDNNGNIKTIAHDDKTITYYYDELNQLVREDNPFLTEGTKFTNGKIIQYAYNTGGNLLEKKEYEFTTSGSLGAVVNTISYEYDGVWKDKLHSISINGNVNAIGYDVPGKDIGNPLSYKEMTFNWEQGRQLKLIANVPMKDTQGNTTFVDMNFSYNDGGIRTKKQVEGVTTNYYLVGDKVTYEETGTEKIYYTYDASGNLVSMNLNGREYYYIRNAQGDIIGLFDGTGTPVVNYTYDSWGKLISIKDGSGNDVTTDTAHVGYRNPYRYRGYRYDNETGLYYLQSRYYNPEWGRFINVDGIVGQTGKLLAHNMFAYCQNDPVNASDPSGFVALRDVGGSALNDDGYDTAKEAAKAFGEWIYDISFYTRHEFSASIYSKIVNGERRYYFTGTVPGDPHSCNPKCPNPEGTKYEAFIHTHTNSNEFSKKDIEIGAEYDIKLYLIGPNLDLQYLIPGDLNSKTVGTIKKINASLNRKQYYEKLLRNSWENHVKSGCEQFSCEYKCWPSR